MDLFVSWKLSCHLVTNKMKPDVIKRVEKNLSQNMYVEFAMNGFFSSLARFKSYENGCGNRWARQIQLTFFVYIRSRYCTYDVFVPISKLKDINNAGFTMVMVIYRGRAGRIDDLRAWHMLPSTNLSCRKTLFFPLRCFGVRYAFDADIICYKFSYQLASNRYIVSAW